MSFYYILVFIASWLGGLLSLAISGWMIKGNLGGKTLIMFVSSCFIGLAVFLFLVPFITEVRVWVGGLVL